MTISRNLPMFVIASFERQFTFHEAKYPVLFEGKSQVTPPVISLWFLTIFDYPNKGIVKYIIEKQRSHWQKVVGFNPLQPDEEASLLLWAGNIITELPVMTSKR